MSDNVNDLESFVSPGEVLEETQEPGSVVEAPIMEAFIFEDVLREDMLSPENVENLVLAIHAPSETSLSQTRHDVLETEQQSEETHSSNTPQTPFSQTGHHALEIEQQSEETPSPHTPQELNEGNSNPPWKKHLRFATKKAIQVLIQITSLIIVSAATGGADTISMFSNGLGGYVVAVCSAPVSEMIGQYTKEDKTGEKTSLKEKFISAGLALLGSVVGGIPPLLPAWLLRQFKVNIRVVLVTATTVLVVIRTKVVDRVSMVMPAIREFIGMALILVITYSLGKVFQLTFNPST